VRAAAAAAHAAAAVLRVVGRGLRAAVHGVAAGHFGAPAAEASGKGETVGELHDRAEAAVYLALERPREPGIEARGQAQRRLDL
jgi:hypothetical protein